MKENFKNILDENIKNRKSKEMHDKLEVACLQSAKDSA